MTIKRIVMILIFAVACVSFVTAMACPFCDAPTLLRAEQIAQCDHLLLARWTGGNKPSDLRGGTAKFEVVAVGFTAGDRFAPGAELELPQYIAGSETATYALMGPDDRLEDWHSPEEISAEGWEFLSKIPPLVKEPEKQAERLMYFIPYFEHPDQMVSNDAFAEFASAPYEVIKPLRDKLPREKILQWLQDKKTPVTRIGFYGLMMGLCGKPEDADVLERRIVTLDGDFRLGIDGVMAGYLLLKGEDGLKVLEDTKMRSTTAKDIHGAEVKLPFSEVYAVMQTLRFMWTYEPDFIPKDRLKQSMHILIERPELADLVITDLARWKDWSQQDRLMTMYDDERFAIPAVRRSIVRYLYYCSQERGEPAADGTPTRPDFAIRAEENLKALELKDPKTVGDARRYLIR